MDIAALIAWIVTAAGGIDLIATWLAAGGVRRRHEAVSRLPVPAVFGHASLAVIGLLLWIAYLITDDRVLAWLAFIVLPIIASVGAFMFVLWRRAFRAGRHHEASEDVERASTSPESRLPVPVVFLHGAAAVTTVVLVLLAALQVGS